MTFFWYLQEYLARFAKKPRTVPPEVITSSMAPLNRKEPHAIEAHFYVNISATELELIFAPTCSRYTYTLQAESELLSLDPRVQHIRNDGTGIYNPGEVQAVSYRVASAVARRLRKSANRNRA
jgi:hypothetical protein